MPTVVILLSDKRSGSTMFQDELCRHPAVATVPYSPHTYLETHWWLMAAVLLDRPGPLFISGKPYAGYGGRRNARALMIDLLEKCVPDFRPPSDDRQLVFEGWEALCRRYANPVFLEKSPQILAQWAALSLMLEWIERTEFDVRIIGLVRNPHGVMYSAAKLFGTEPGGRQFAWLNGCRNLLAFGQMVPRSSFTRIRYEDLIEDPKRGFAEIAAFIGIAPSEVLGCGAHADSTEKWKRDLDYRLSLDPAVRQMAEHLGYSVEDLENPNARETVRGTASAAPTRRHARLWLNRRRDRFFQPAYFRLRAWIRRQP